MAPLVTIVIPVYNRATLVARALDSVLAQTQRPLRLVIVDNNSTDGSLAAVTHWARSHRMPDFDVTVLSESAPGAAAARNRGLSEVMTPWTMFFDSDDTMRPDHVKNALACAEAHPQAEIIGWNTRLHNLDGSERTLPFATADALYHCVMHGTMATQRYMARTALLRRAGGWDPDIKAWNDIELGTRLLALRPLIVMSEAPLAVDVWSQEASITGTDYLSRAPRLEQALDKMQANLDADCHIIINLKRALLAALYRREGGTADSERLLATALSLTASPRKRRLLRLAYSYTAKGGRGIARILKPFL